MNGRPDGRADGRTLPVIDMCVRLYKRIYEGINNEPSMDEGTYMQVLDYLLLRTYCRRPAPLIDTRLHAKLSGSDLCHVGDIFHRRRVEFYLA